MTNTIEMKNIIDKIGISPRIECTVASPYLPPLDERDPNFATPREWENLKRTEELNDIIDHFMWMYDHVQRGHVNVSLLPPGDCLTTNDLV